MFVFAKFCFSTSTSRSSSPLMVFHKEILARAEESPNFNGVAHRLLWRELHRLNAIRSGERLTVWGCGEDLHPSRMRVFRIRSSEARFLKYPKQPSINGCFNWMNQSFFKNTWTNHQTSIHVTNSVFFWVVVVAHFGSWLVNLPPP